MYVLTEDDSSPSPGNVRYVGKTIQKPLSRLYHHLQDRHRREVYRDRWIHKLVESGREPRMHVVALVPNEYASKAEMRLIASFRKAGSRLTNLSDGGEGAPGHKVSEETRKRISRAHKGVKERFPMSEEKRLLFARIRSERWANPENRKRQSEKMKDRLARVPFTPERKLRISAALRGKSLSPIAREKIRAANIGKLYGAETRRKHSSSNCRRFRIEKELAGQMRFPLEMF